MVGNNRLNKSFSPFKKTDVTALTSSDLAVLREVKEGWYIDYKRLLPNPREIAKAISAFANTYGGWLFFGIEEESKEKPVAGRFCGVPLSELESAIQKIRQSATEHLSPSPYFEYVVVYGPDSEIDLPADAAVICLHIPQSVTAPHVHSGGAIYRRVSDGSEPKAETERHQLQLMWDRRKAEKKRYKKWVGRKLELSDAEEDQPYLRILVDGDPYGSRGESWKMDVAKLKDLFNDRNSGPCVPLESVFMSGHGIVARQTSSLHRHESLGLTWIVGRNLKCEVVIPIYFFSFRQAVELYGPLTKYKNADRFIALLENSKSSDGKVLDLSQIFSVLVAVANMQIKLFRAAGIDRRFFHAKVDLRNVWRTTPFLDSEVMLNRMDKFGLPLCLNDRVVVPRGSEVDTFFQVDFGEKDDESEYAEMYSCAFWLFDLICAGLGLLGLMENKEEALPLFRELREAWIRSHPEATVSVSQTQGA